jgi:hypothetical protein
MVRALAHWIPPLSALGGDELSSTTCVQASIQSGNGTKPSSREAIEQSSVGGSGGVFKKSSAHKRLLDTLLIGVVRALRSNHTGVTLMEDSN